MSERPPSVAEVRDQLTLLDGKVPVFVRHTDGYFYPARIVLRESGIVEIQAHGYGVCEDAAARRTAS